MRAADADKSHAIVRAVRSAIGLGLIGLGAYVFIKAPDHAGAYAIILTTLGGVLFDPHLVKPSNIRRILEK
jgi:hypothetical protein